MADLTDSELDERAARIEGLYTHGQDDIAHEVEAEIQVALTKSVRSLDRSSTFYARALVGLTVALLFLTGVLVYLTEVLVRKG